MQENEPIIDKVPAFQSTETAQQNAELADIAANRERSAEPKPDFTQVRQAAVLQSNGTIELNWVVTATIGDKVEVRKMIPEPDGKYAEKELGADRLASFQPRFLDDQRVQFDEPAGASGWRVLKQAANGKVTIVTDGPTPDKVVMKHIDAAQLAEMQLPKEPASATAGQNRFSDPADKKRGFFGRRK